jgi:hypothetical protein
MKTLIFFGAALLLLVSANVGGLMLALETGKTLVSSYERDRRVVKASQTNPAEKRPVVTIDSEAVLNSL